MHRTGSWSEAMCPAVAHHAVLAQGLNVEGGLEAEQQGRLCLHRLSGGRLKHIKIPTIWGT